MIAILEKARLEKALNWALFNQGYTEYEYIGKINYGYVLLTPLRPEIPAADFNTSIGKFPDPIISETLIAAPMNLKCETIVDLEKSHYGPMD